MSASEEAARLREQADQLDALAGLEAELTAAKEAFRANPDVSATGERKHAAVAALQAARAVQRKDRPPFATVGGDAVKDEG